MPKKETNNVNQFLNGLMLKISRVPFTQKMLFVYHLETMTKAGLPLINSLKILSEEIQNKKMRVTILAIKNEVEKGRQLSEALAQYPNIFPSIYINMIAAGESGGKLEQALGQVSSQMKKSHELTAHIRGALIYPIVVLVAIIGIGLEMVFFVLPKILTMFDDFNAQLPLATRILVTTVKFMENFGIWVIIIFILLIIGIILLLKQPPVKVVTHKFNLHLPIFGKIIKQINLARFTITLSSLLDSTIPVIEAVKITASVQTNVTYRDCLLKGSEELKKGKALSEILSDYPLTFPPMVTEMLFVGEQSGSVEHMLSEMAEYYAGEVDGTMKNLSAIVEPLIIIILGLMVAGIAVAVIMPMYSLAQNF